MMHLVARATNNGVHTHATAIYPATPALTPTWPAQISSSSIVPKSTFMNIGWKFLDDSIKLSKPWLKR